ncbi:hypothetical protein BG74_03835 [Sodalis-like endosymbiont of Proechinophthirus fluctus]|nr:hypothetical protein BG74_03835 [Sodalis-like endosymbiont of Proechinophthirus fluctus]
MQFPGSTICLINEKIKHGRIHKLDSISTEQPAYKTLSLTMINRKDKLEAISNTSHPHWPRTKDVKQSRMLQKAKEEHNIVNH